MNYDIQNSIIIIPDSHFTPTHASSHQKRKLHSATTSSLIRLAVRAIVFLSTRPYVAKATGTDEVACSKTPTNIEKLVLFRSLCPHTVCYCRVQQAPSMRLPVVVYCAVLTCRPRRLPILSMRHTKALAVVNRCLFKHHFY